MRGKVVVGLTMGQMTHLTHLVKWRARPRCAATPPGGTGPVLTKGQMVFGLTMGQMARASAMRRHPPGGRVWGDEGGSRQNLLSTNARTDFLTSGRKWSEKISDQWTSRL